MLENRVYEHEDEESMHLDSWIMMALALAE